MKNLIYIVAILFFDCQAISQTLPPKVAYPIDVKQIHSGHSLTDPLFTNPWPGQYVNLITQLRGVWAGDDIAKSTIPGSPMFYRWEHDHNIYPHSARHHIANWELMVITEGIPLPHVNMNPPNITDAKHYLSLYVNNAWNNGNNGNGTPTLLWTTWTNLDGTEGPWRQTLDTYEPYWEEMMDYANQQLPIGATPVYIIPGHKMMAKLYDDIQDGIVPGITNIDDFFSDQIHVNNLGAYAVAMIHYACIYNESPVGLPIDLAPNEPSSYQRPTQELANYLQTMIWEVVTSYERTGIYLNDSASVHHKNIFKYTISPNPVQDQLTINDKHEEKIIFDAKGKIVFQGTQPIIDMKHLNPGIYFLNINNHFYKIIKQ